MNNKQRCAGTTRFETPCQNYALGISVYCYRHGGRCAPTKKDLMEAMETIAGGAVGSPERFAWSVLHPRAGGEGQPSAYSPQEQSDE